MEEYNVCSVPLLSLASVVRVFAWASCLAKTGSTLISSKSLGSLWLIFNALIVKMK